MKVVKERIKGQGEIRIPKEIMEDLRLNVGEEVELSIEDDMLVIRPRRARRKLQIRPEIIDDLVEKEEFFEPEWT